MKPASFTYHAPSTVGEALALLSEHGSDAKILAGGQSLVPLMNFRLARPAHLIDLGKVDGLTGIREDGDWIRVGAMTTHLEMEQSPLLKEVCPLLPAVAKWIGHVQIRTRGTLGGSIVHADPSAEWPTALLALGGELRIRSAAGDRNTDAQTFFLGYLTTDIQDDELLVEVALRKPAPGTGWSIQEVARRHGDFALVVVVALVELNSNRTCRRVRLAVGGVGPAPLDVSATASPLLEGRVLTPDLIEQAANAVAGRLDPDSDLHASAEYRREVAATLTARALTEALGRAEQGASQ